MAIINKKDENKALCAEILSVGTELLLGDILNTNTKYLSSSLAASGVNVYYETTVGDNPQRLENAIKQALKRSDIIITTGGLGPTEDDLTKEIVSKVLGLKLVLDQKTLDDINMFFVKSGRIPTENNIKQAYMPEGCKILYNKNGTAPGAIIKKNDKIAIILPGPPKEMIPMFDEYVAQFLSQKSNATIHSQTLRVFGIGESQLESKIPEFLSNKNPSVALYAKTGEVYIRITAKAQNKQQAVLMCTDVAKLLKEVLGEYIYSFDDNQMETIVIKELINKNKKLATAESCTGGLISKKLTDVSGSSEVFECGIVSYGNNIKADLLNVPQKTLDTFGAVSEETAIAMAKGALKVSGADIAVGVTGVAGPDGGTIEKPVGLVFICLAEKNGNVYVKKTQCSYVNERDYIREQTALYSLDMVRRFLNFPHTLNINLKEGTPVSKPIEQQITAADVFGKDEIVDFSAGAIVAEALQQNSQEKFNVKLENPYIEEISEDLSQTKELSSNEMISRYLTSRDENNQQSNEENLYEDEENIEELPLKWYQKVFKAVFPLKTDPKSEIIRKLILIFAVPIFLISGFFVTKYYIDSYNNDQLIQSLKNKYNETTTVPQEKKDEIGYPSDYIDSFFELYKQNKDVKGYIKIDGTAIDFPIVQYTDNDYYLRRDFNKKNSDHGIPFFDFRVDLKRPATNFLIYGHNMHDKQMFNEILNYKNLDYYKNHPIITMDTVYEKSQWKVFAAYVANASSEDGPVFQYHNFINCTNETIYNNFIDQVELRSIIQTGVDVKYGDQLLTLSTCTYEIGSGRFVVMARKVRPGESTSVNTSSATLNPAPLYPDKWYEKFPNTPKPDGADSNASDYIDESDNPTIDSPEISSNAQTSRPPTSFPEVEISQPSNVHPDASDTTNTPNTSNGNENPNTSSGTSNDVTSNIESNTSSPPITSDNITSEENIPPVTSETPPPITSDSPVENPVTVNPDVV